MSVFIQINRVVVHGKLACDIRLRPGLNVLQGVGQSGNDRSSNKVGKTGLVYLIQYGLGKTASKQDFHFAPIADSLSYLYLEVEGRGGTITIQRSLQGPSTAARIFSGEYHEGIAEGDHEVVSIDGLSDYLLTFFGIPIVQVKEERGNLTPLSLRLLMRAFILEQRLSFGRLFNQVQPEQRKSDLIGFLTGIYSLERFTLEEELSKIQIEVNNQTVNLSRVSEFIDLQGIEKASVLRNLLASLEERLQGSHESLQILRSSVRASVDQIDEGRLSKLRETVVAASQQLLAAKTDARRLEGEKERLALLGGSLRADLARLRKVRSSLTILGSVEFTSCPRCLQEITKEMKWREDEGLCSLCSRPLLIKSDDAPLLSKSDRDIEHQVEELSEVERGVEAELEAVKDHLADLQVHLDRSQVDLERETSEYVAPYIDALTGISRDAADLEREIAVVRRDLHQLEHLERLESGLSALIESLAYVRSQLQIASKPNGEIKGEFQSEYDRTLRALKFPDVKASSIDSQDFMPKINGFSYIHEGNAYTGLAVLAYHLAMWHFGLSRDVYMPSFIVVDSPAVGDMNAESENAMLDFFASLDKSICQEHPWQILLTTRNVTPSLRPYVFKTLSSPHRRLFQPSEEVFGEFVGLFEDL